MLELFELEGLTEDGQVSMHAIKNKLEDGTFSPELFNQMIKNDCSFSVYSRNHCID